VTYSRVRRERFGHIELACPVIHSWFHRGSPNILSLLLNIAPEELEEVIYYRKMVVVEPGLGLRFGVQSGRVLDFEDAILLTQRCGEKFRWGIGATAIEELLAKLDLPELAARMRAASKGTRDRRLLKKTYIRQGLADSFYRASIDPRWMVLHVIPVIPPDLRPLVLLRNDSFATSDLNDHYRRVINRNNRTKKLIEQQSPDVIIWNEKRMLQETVDSLLDNARSPRPVLGSNDRPLKSLTTLIEGKYGRIRENLLGKRVDYSGRSVAVPDPRLPCNQCALPVRIATKLLEPFMIRYLRTTTGLADTIRSAQRMLEQWPRLTREVLAAIAKDHKVLVQRFPTTGLGRIQCFDVSLTDDRAIHLPVSAWQLLTGRDEDSVVQVHLLLSKESREEASCRLMPGCIPCGNVDSKPAQISSPANTISSTMESCTEENHPRNLWQGRGRRLPMPRSPSARRIPLSAYTMFREFSVLRRHIYLRDRLLRKVHTLSRELVASLSDLRIVEEDCGDQKGVTVHKGLIRRLNRQNAHALAGRSFIVQQSVRKDKGQRGNCTSWREALSHADKMGMKSLQLRSPFSCLSKNGLCMRCRGLPRSPLEQVMIGELVGIRSALALAEPLYVLLDNLLSNDQFRLRYYSWYRGNIHTSVSFRSLQCPEATLKIVKGLIGLLQGRSEGLSAHLSPVSGYVSSVRKSGYLWYIALHSDDDRRFTVRLSHCLKPIVREGQYVNRGQPLSAGKSSLTEVATCRSRMSCAWSFILRTMKLYDSLGVDVDPRHVETVARVLAGSCQILDPRDTEFQPGSIVSYNTVQFVNRNMKEKGGREAAWSPVFVGSSQAVSLISSPLALAAYSGAKAAILTAAVAGRTDPLSNPIACVIAGRSVLHMGVTHQVPEYSP